MPPDDAYSTGGGGKLKLKGSKVTDGRIEKKKKKKPKPKQSEESSASEAVEPKDDTTTTTTDDRKGDTDTDTDVHRSASQREREGTDTGTDTGGDGGTVMVGKTEAERRYEQQRRKRLQDRLKREGVKTHKERVEELNKYLSSLTEHHDMPKIGPG
ncbi:hypothetical protein PHISP_06257 [Aspergillus sp. HF37]|nr:hypothetical protein PHISP_06257 [Aspergillus sp. HF37]